MLWLILLGALVLLLTCCAGLYAMAVAERWPRLGAAALALSGGPMIFGLLVWAGVAAWAAWRDKTGPLPVELAVAQELYAQESGGWREGCGVAVFSFVG